MTTVELLARARMSTATLEDKVQWALSQLVAGIDSRSVRILAGLEAPLHWSEVEPLFRSALRELAITEPDNDKWPWQLACETAKAVCTGTLDHVRAVQVLADVCEWAKYPANLMPFYCLKHAHLAFEYGEPEQDDYPGVTQENFAQFTQEHAAEFLRLHCGSLSG